MRSITVFYILLLTIVIGSFVQAVPVTENIIHSCDAYYYDYGLCSDSISSPPGCKETKLDLANTNTSKTCTSVHLFWNYPVANLTTIIETPFTQKKQAYILYIDNAQLKPYISHVYRIVNGQETEVTTSDKTLIQYSDANYQVILKFEGPSTLYYYGVFINYNIVTM
jgi:hypothetical protein